jgi:putative membrane protein
MIRKLMASSALIALMTAGALNIVHAQTEPAKPATEEATATVPEATAPAIEVADSKQAIAPAHPTLASKIIGRSVYASSDPQSDNIGDVNDLIVDEKGAVTHAVVGVGGFLGIGEKNVAVPFDQLKVVEANGDLRLVYEATKEQLEAAPAFDRTAYDPAARAANTNTAADGAATTAPATAPAADQSAANTNKAAPSDANAPAMEDFVQTAAVSNMFEIESSKLAKDHVQNANVQAFAQKMIDDHTKAGEELKAAVQSANAGITVPNALEKTHKDQLDKLQAATGADFDRQYVAAQVKAHDEAVQLFQNFADSGDKSTVQQFAQNTLPTLQDHQKMIHDISDKLGVAATGAPTTTALTDEECKAAWVSADANKDGTVDAKESARYLAALRVANRPTTDAALTKPVFMENCKAGYFASTVTAEPGAPFEGANSFTEGQAQDRILAAGYSNVSPLAKDDKGIWRGTAEAQGKKVNVAVDYKGNVVTTNM